MAGIKKLFVSLLFDGNNLEVGELVLSDQKIYFKNDNQLSIKEVNIEYLKIDEDIFNYEIDFIID